MLTFWRYGYETTSIVDLTTAMGVTAPSLYAAYGDKRRLFLEAVRLYAGDDETMARRIEAAPSAHSAARDMLNAAATAFTGAEMPKGCLLASATASGSAASADIREAIAEIRRRTAAHLSRRIERDIAAGVLPPDADAGALSRFVVALLQGLSGLARDGATRTDLTSIVEVALEAWPRLSPDTSIRG